MSSGSKLHLLQCLLEKPVLTVILIVLSFLFVIRSVGWINRDWRLLLLVPWQSLHLLRAIITSRFVNAISPINHVLTIVMSPVSKITFSIHQVLA